MKFFFLLLIPLSAFAGPDYLSEADEKVFCEKVKGDPEVSLIYRTKDSAPDPRGDEALWWTFKRKFKDKIPLLAKGKNEKMLEGQQWRFIPVKDKERMLRCFHGPEYVYPVNPRNVLEKTHPLLTSDDPEKILTLFKSASDQETLEIEGVAYNVKAALESVEGYNKNKIATNGCEEGKLISIESQVNPIRPEGFQAMFRNVICKSAIQPKLGDHDHWNLKGRFAPPVSKLLVALANGDSSRILATTKENDLLNWVLDQKERSVSIHEIFEKSYALNQGDIYRSLLTIENVLSEDFYSRHRQNLTMSTKMSKIINHRGGNFDLYGAWYHLFGMLTYGFDSGSKTKSKFMGWIEKGTSVVYKTANDAQEDFMIQGGAIGADLRGKIKKIKTSEDLATYCKGASEVTQTSDYLNLVD
jgi:hypothetical protein